MGAETAFDPKAHLQTLSALADDKIDLAEAALAIAAFDQPGVSVDRYRNHLKKICEEVAARHHELIAAGANDDSDTQLAALKHVVADKYGYVGDTENYHDLQNASLMRVIDRARGLPVALALLYIHAARAQGWVVFGLDFPGHFLCRLDHAGQRLIFDPFGGCQKLGAADLRALIKESLGERAELSGDYFEPAGNREILIRLQNNIKYRQIETEDYEGAMKTVEIMRMVDPSEYRLLLDAGVLYARTKRTAAAIESLEEYIKRAPDNRDRQEALLLLRQLQEEPGGPSGRKPSK